MKKLKLFLLVIVLVVCGCTYYVQDYYHATEKVVSDENVTISKTDFGYFLDGPGKDTALIFYPGAKVEDVSYMKLLKQISKEGVDCFLVHMPCNLAILNPNKANQVFDTYSYSRWYISGHSLGGAMAANYAYNHTKQLDGLVLVAAYSTKDLSHSNLSVLSIYGSKDHVLNKEKYETNQKNLPKNTEEEVIVGANHAGYGMYGPQKKDGKASISNSKQIDLTAQLIVKFCQ